MAVAIAELGAKTLPKLLQIFRASVGSGGGRVSRLVQRATDTATELADGATTLATGISETGATVEAISSAAKELTNEVILKKLSLVHDLLPQNLRPLAKQIEAALTSGGILEVTERTDFVDLLDQVIENKGEVNLTSSDDETSTVTKHDGKTTITSDHGEHEIEPNSRTLTKTSNGTNDEVNVQATTTLDDTEQPFVTTTFEHEVEQADQTVPPEKARGKRRKKRRLERKRAEHANRKGKEASTTKPRSNEVRQLRERAEAAEKRADELEQTTKNGRAYQVSEYKDDSDVEILAKAAKNALELELTRGGSWISLGWRFGLIKLEGVTSEEQIPAYLAKNLINLDFTKKVREFLNTNQFNTDGLEKPQKLAMHCLKWTTRFGRFLSKDVRRNIRDFDQLFYQFGGYISHMPLIGPAVGALHKYVYGFIKSYLIDYFMAFDPEIEAVSKVSDKYFGSRKAKPK